MRKALRMSWIVAFAAAALSLPRRADAHKLVVFAAAEGRAVRGEAYFAGGGRLAGVSVMVLGPAGQTLGQVRTDEKGEFRFVPALRCDHLFVVDDGTGHRGECPVPAADLPADLPAPSGRGSAPAATRPAPSGTRPTTAPATMPTDEAIDALVERLSEVAARAVRRELHARDERMRVRDVAAGIGFILGLAGVWMMWKYKRRPGRERG